MTSNTFVSIIMPTYHDWKRLTLCIEALDRQTYPKDSYEVIIVNNDPQDQAPAYFYLPANFTLVHEGKPGSYAARNKGISLAKGNIYGFTDSDCIPQPTWIENAVKRFEKGNVDRIAGKIDFIFQNEAQKTLVELYESVYEFDQKRAVKVHQASVTANLFVRKELFDVVGLFDASKMSGDDFGWNRRANACNFNIEYGDDVIIKHPARSTLKEFNEKKRREFGGKKSYKISGIKSIAKHAAFLPYLFYTIVIKKNLRLFSVDRQLSSADVVKVFFVNGYLYLICSSEYFRLLFKGTQIR
ncbi:glycosyltransferase [Pontibacter liquoris]|uniref:glycosyltransferase n=1 Tax=Pontibacter liquoris TaxID=2905677 RepID=UPI001FA72614|nr:glycosyltransferase [Pontibacter liquoris]